MTEKQLDSLVTAFRSQFGADVETEAVNSNGRYRITVVSAQFATMPHLQRQDALWETADRILPRDATIDISLILAYAPGELAAAE